MSQKERQEAMAMFYYFIGDEETSKDEIIDRFSRNSHRYDKVMGALGYGSPVFTAQTTAELFPSNRKEVYILDVAAGTGLCAEKLYSHGFKNMDALDPSSTMLDEAKTKGLYGQYFVQALGKNTLNIANGTYDAVTISAMSSMVLIKLPIEAFEELIRIVKPGGYVINTTLSQVLSTDGVDNGWLLRENIKTLEDQGKWKQIERRHYGEVVLGTDVAVSVYKVLT